MSEQEQSLEEVIKNAMSESSSNTSNENIEQKQETETNEVAVNETKEMSEKTEPEKKSHKYVDKPETPIVSNDVSVLDATESNNEAQVIGETSDGQKVVKAESVGIGKFGLSMEEIMKGGDTPAVHMSSLEKFTEKIEREEAEAKEEYEQKVRQSELNEQLNKIQEEQKRENSFDDNIIEEDDEEDELADATFLESLTIIKPKSLTDEYTKIIQARNKTQHTTTVPLINSGYSFDIAGLSSPEITDISTSMSTKNQYQYWLYIYTKVWEKIQNTSIGTIDFDTFLKRTALSEFDAVTYGLFSSTYPEKNVYPMTCQKCKQPFQFEYANRDFMTLIDESKASEQLKAFIKGEALDPTALFREANTNKIVRVFLRDSGMIVELQHPTLHTQLIDVLKVMVDRDINTSNASESLLNSMPYIASVLVPEVGQENVPVKERNYVQYTDLSKKLGLLSSINDLDDARLAEGIERKIMTAYNVDFKFKGIKCPLCGEVYPDSGVNFINLLFMIRHSRQLKISKK